MKKVKNEKKSRKTLQWILGSLLIPLLIAGMINPYVGYVIMAMMISLITISIFKGRYWCGWLCMRGSFLERHFSSFSGQRKIPEFFKSIYFRLFIIIVLMGMFSLQLWLAGWDLAKIGMIFVRLCIVTTLVAIPLGLIYRPRIWCSFCPMGTIQGFLGKNKNLVQVSEDCKECSLCEKACPIDTNPSKSKHHGKVKSENCLRCENCVLSCPSKALKIDNK
ncbi:4Fe-4S binding protein [Candidatus Margulisiibacteriota bacterium]